MNKRGISKLLIIVLIIAVLIIGFFTLRSIFKEQVTEQSLEEEYMKIINMTDAELQTFIAEKIEFCVEKNSDPYDMALASLDETICEKTKQKSDCTEDVLVVKSLMTGNKNLCKDFEKATRDFCNNPTISECNTLEEEQILICKAAVTKDISYCNQIADDEDQLVCNSIVSGQNKYLAAFRNECVPYIEVDVHSFQGKPIDCQGVITPEAKDLCIRNQHLRFLSDATQTKCSQITDPDIKNACNSILTENPTLCESVNLYDAKIMCATEIALLTENTCDVYQDKEVKAACENLS